MAGFPAITSPNGEMTASRMAVDLQTVAQGVLLSPDLVEVSEGVLSNCPEPIEEFAQRLIFARDSDTPLVEVKLVTDGTDAEQLRDLFGIDGRVASSITGASGEETHVERRRPGTGLRETISRLEFDRLGYVTRSSGLTVTYGTHLETFLDMGDYSGYWEDSSGNTHFSQYGLGVSTGYEAGNEIMHSALPDMRAFLEGVAEVFPEASLPDEPRQSL